MTITPAKASFTLGVRASAYLYGGTQFGSSPHCAQQFSGDREQLSIIQTPGHPQSLYRDLGDGVTQLTAWTGPHHSGQRTPLDSWAEKR